MHVVLMCCRTLVQIPVARILEDKKSIPDKELNSYRLCNNNEFGDFVFFPQILKNSIFDIDAGFAYPINEQKGHNRAVTPTKSSKNGGKSALSASTLVSSAPVISILVGGKDHSVAVYNLGVATRAQDSDKTGSAMKESAVNLISKSVMSMYYSFVGSGGNGTESANSGSQYTRETKADHARVHDRAINVLSELDFQDPKRRILRLSADPSSRLVASADALGRVMLFDCTIQAFVRMWKGLRFAELGWTTASPSNNSHKSDSHKSLTASAEGEFDGPNNALNIVIHAPLLGLVYIYQMTHGPCLRIVPVGMNCHIYTTFLYSSDTHR